MRGEQWLRDSAPEHHVVAVAHRGRNDGAEVVKFGNALPCTAPGPFRTVLEWRADATYKGT